MEQILTEQGSAALNKTELQRLIAEVDSCGGGTVKVPWPLDYGYVAGDMTTYPDLSGCVNDLSVVDEGKGGALLGIPGSKRGKTTRVFFYTAQTTPPGQHDGNGQWIVGGWHPHHVVENTGEAPDNVRASYFFFLKGKAVYQIMMGDISGNFPDKDKLKNFSIKSYNEDGSGRHYILLENWKTQCVAYGLGTTEPQAYHWFARPASGNYPIAAFHDPYGNDLQILLKSKDYATTLRLVDGNVRLETSFITYGFIKSQPRPTNQRPSAAVVGEGAKIYDSSINKPIWSDGSVWRDAMGNQV